MPDDERTQTERLKALARSHGTSAVQALNEVMIDPDQPGAARAIAAKAILDRGFGAPERRVQQNVDVTIVDQRQAHFEALQRLAARSATTPAAPGTPAAGGASVAIAGPNGPAATAARLMGRPRDPAIEDAEFEEIGKGKGGAS